MNMYMWISEYLSNYRNGRIIVIATNLEEAKNKALKYFEKYDKEAYSWDYNMAGELDEFSEGAYLDRKTRFLDDLSGYYEISEVIFIEGSE